MTLTGCRIGEIRQAKWNEFDFDQQLWTIPPEHFKQPKGGQRIHKVHLSSLAIKVLERLKSHNTGDYVIASPKDKNKELTDKAIGRAVRRIQTNIDGLQNEIKTGSSSTDQDTLTFSPHDIRRSFRSHVQPVTGASMEVAELLLGHSLGGLVATYNVNDFWDERVDALNVWSDKIEEII